MAIPITSGDLVQQRPGGVGLYAFTDPITAVTVCRTAPAGDGAELVVSVVENVILITGGIEGAQYRVSSADDDRFVMVTIRANAPGTADVQPLRPGSVIMPGQLVVLDPYDQRMLSFPFPSPLKDYAITINPMRQAVDPLTYDQSGIVGHYVVARFLAHTATHGDRYRVTVKGVTDELVSQEWHVSVDVLLQ